MLRHARERLLVAPCELACWVIRIRAVAELRSQPKAALSADGRQREERNQHRGHAAEGRESCCALTSWYCRQESDCWTPSNSEWTYRCRKRCRKHDRFKNLLAAYPVSRPETAHSTQHTHSTPHSTAHTQHAGTGAHSSRRHASRTGGCSRWHGSGVWLSGTALSSRAMQSALKSGAVK